MNPMEFASIVETLDDETMAELYLAKKEIEEESSKANKKELATIAFKRFKNDHKTKYTKEQLELIRFTLNASASKETA